MLIFRVPLLTPDGTKYEGQFSGGKSLSATSRPTAAARVLSAPVSSMRFLSYCTLRACSLVAAGKFNGLGIYTRADGMKFEGEFRDGQVMGLGLLTYADGTNGLPRQEGEWDGSRLARRSKVRLGLCCTFRLHRWRAFPSALVRICASCVSVWCQLLCWYEHSAC